MKTKTTFSNWFLIGIACIFATVISVPLVLYYYGTNSNLAVTPVIFIAVAIVSFSVHYVNSRKPS